jgi:casein kinase I family protein HRR25
MDNLNNKNEHSKKDNIVNRTFFNKYHCIQKIGKGSFGSIYKCEYNGDLFALKLEKKETNQNSLENEAIIMNYLKGPNIPFVKFYGSTIDYNILVMQLLGKSLEYYFEEKKSFSLKTVCMLGFQMVSILEYIHNKHILHIDIKPDNFVMGLNNLSKYVYLLDFGLAKKYRSSRTLVQIPFENNNRVVGTTRYASINALKGYEHSRRDDLEAAGYVLVYLIKGKLPWQGITSKDKVHRYRKLLKRKEEISPKDLCCDLPEEFEEYISYTRNLGYLEQPDYEMLKGLFIRMLNRINCQFDYIYDWTNGEESTRMDGNKIELNSNINKKTTFTSHKHTENFNNTDEEINKNSYNSTIGNIKNTLAFKNNINDEEIHKNTNYYPKINEIMKEDEEAIIFSKRKDYLNSLNNEEDAVCCTSSCILF